MGNIKNEKTYNSTTHLYNKDSGEESSDLLFNNLIWLTTKEASVYLRKSVNALHTLVSRGHIKARKFRNRLYFNKKELAYLIETSQFRGGY
ncbi:helix-turn-helix domain-containing protein [Bacteriovorax antarcticus]|uniref:helix-turn-helix domain-containing protein n=1 Tax=Bacteriovorax antarcticus TaxID=3088717 RepID=UPI00396AF914